MLTYTALCRQCGAEAAFNRLDERDLWVEHHWLATGHARITVQRAVESEDNATRIVCSPVLA